MGQSKASPAKEGQSIPASCCIEGMVNKPHRQTFTAPVVCLRPPRLERGLSLNDADRAHMGGVEKGGMGCVESGRGPATVTERVQTH